MRERGLNMLVMRKNIVPAKVSLHKDGRYGAQIILGYDDETGKVKTRTIYGKTSREVKEKQAEFLKRLEAEAVSTDTFEFNLRRWLYDSKAGWVKPTTFDRLEQIVNYQILPCLPMLAHRLVAEIDAYDIQRIMLRNLNEGYSYSTLSATYKVLKAYFKFEAARSRAPFKNPMDTVSMFKREQVLEKQAELRVSGADKTSRLKMHDKLEARVLTDAEIERLKMAAFRQFGNGKPMLKQAAYFIFMLNTGLRAGEALALRYDDFDFEAHTMRIERNAVQVRNRDAHGKAQHGYNLRIQTPKTRTSRDTVPVNEVAMDIIRTLRAEEPEGYAGYIIHDEGSTMPIGARAFAKRFENLLRLAGVEHCGLHSLRHTYASKAFAATDGNIKFVSAMLRHKDVAFTANQYITLLEQYKEKMVANFTV